MRLARRIKQRIDQSDIGTRIANGAFWSFLGSAVSKAVVLVSTILCARILGKSGFGEFGMVRTTISLFAVVGFAGMGITATKHISEFRNRAKERIGSIYLLTNGFAILMGILLTIAIIISAPFLARNTLNAEYLSFDIQIGAILLFVTILNGVQSGILSGFEAFRSIAQNTLWGGLAEAAFMLLGAYLYGVTGAILGYGFGFFVLYLFNRNSIRNLIKSNCIDTSYKSFNKSDLSLLYKFSLPAMLSSLCVAPTYWLVKSFLVRMNGFEELAEYEAASQWQAIILFIPSAISQVVLPILSSTVSDGKSRFWKILKINLLLNGGVALIIATCVSVASPFIIKMYGETFSDYNTLIFLALSTIFSSLANVVGLSISSRSKMWIGFMCNFLWAITTVALSYIFISCNMGASGVAGAILIAYALHTVIQLIYLKSITK